MCFIYHMYCYIHKYEVRSWAGLIHLENVDLYIV
jgi:hypothetical protein